MRINGLIIPRSYNDYFSRSDPQAIKNLIAMSADAQLNTESSNPIQNKAVAVLIPATANENNKLTDINFVNSTVGTNTANYIYKTDTGGNKIPFSSVTELEEYTGTVTQNDYAFVTGTDSDGNIYYDRYKANVSGDVVTWAKEYRLNNSSFTAAQWAAISSGITAELVAQIGQGGSGDNTPIGAILPYGGANAPAGYIICDGRAVSRIDYDKLFEKIGTTFGSGDGSTTFNVPDLRDKVAQGANGNLGEELEAGLPNITGTINLWSENSNYHILSSEFEGALEGNSYGSYHTHIGNGASKSGYKGVNFDASNSNDIYGNSDTVQPPAVAVNFIIKATASTGEVPADVELDDDKTTTANVWSASKIYDEILTKINDENELDTEFDDTVDLSPTTPETAYTCPYDGVIYWYSTNTISSVAELQIFINGISIFKWTQGSGTSEQKYGTLIVKKGDKIYHTPSSVNNLSGYGRWYRKRNYSLR